MFTTVLTTGSTLGFARFFLFALLDIFLFIGINM